MDITWDNKHDILKLLPHRMKVMFAVFCANQVRHLLLTNKSADKSAEEALRIVERWLEGKATKDECNEAAYYTYCAATDRAKYTPCITHAAQAATNAVDAVCRYNGASRLAEGAAGEAVHATDYSEDIKQQQVEYLRSLYLQSLPEEQRNCWLVNACI